MQIQTFQHLVLQENGTKICQTYLDQSDAFYNENIVPPKTTCSFSFFLWCHFLFHKETHDDRYENCLLISQCLEKKVRAVCFMCVFVGYSCVWDSFYCNKSVHLVDIFGNVSVVQVFTVSLNREREASGKLCAVFKLTFV